MSGGFTDTSRNANGLCPRPAQAVGEHCVHRDVEGHGAQNSFSVERGHPVHPVKLPSTSVSLSVGLLAPGEQTSNHRHAYESLVYVLEGEGFTRMEGHTLEWRAGDAFYTPPWAWHQHVAAPGVHVRYLTATNMPLLERIGQTVLREEEER